MNRVRATNKSGNKKRSTKSIDLLLTINWNLIERQNVDTVNSEIIASALLASVLKGIQFFLLFCATEIM